MVLYVVTITTLSTIALKTPYVEENKPFFMVSQIHFLK